MTKYNCRTENKEVCHNLTIENFKVGTYDEIAKVKIPLPTCEKKEVQKDICVQVPDLETKCLERNVVRRIRITKSICDGRKVLRQGFKIPVAQCMPSQPNCKMVPKQVCVNQECPQTNYCNTCENFINTGEGFGKV